MSCCEASVAAAALAIDFDSFVALSRQTRSTLIWSAKAHSIPYPFSSRFHLVRYLHLPILQNLHSSALPSFSSTHHLETYSLSQSVSHQGIYSYPVVTKSMELVNNASGASPCSKPITLVTQQQLTLIQQRPILIHHQHCQSLDFHSAFASSSLLEPELTLPLYQHPPLHDLSSIPLQHSNLYKPSDKLSMDGTSALHLPGDTASRDSEFPTTSLGEITAQETETSDLAYSIKDYDVRVLLDSRCHITDVVQTKSPSEVVAIIQEFYDAKRQLDHMTIKGRYSASECRRMCRAIRLYQIYHNAKVRSLPSTLDISHLSTRQINKLRSAMEYDQKAGEATWVLFEKQRQMHSYLTAWEKLVTIFVERFVLDEEDESVVQASRVKIAKARHRLKDLATRVVNARGKAMSRGRGG
jgi:hypothetical protein